MYTEYLFLPPYAFPQPIINTDIQKYILTFVNFYFLRIKNQLLDTESRYIVDREERVRGYQNGGYHGGGDMIQHGGRERSVDPDTRDIAKMGYSVYSGNGRNQSSDNIPMQNVR